MSIKHSIEPLWQGNTNGCGTTSLAMALNGLRRLSGKTNTNITQKDLDQKRPFDLFTAPGTLVKLAGDHGYFAKQYNHSSFQDIKVHLDNKHLLIALHNAINNQGKAGPLHYAVIHGYQDSATGNETLLISDPGRKSGNPFELTYQDFYPYWEHPKLGLIPIGVCRFMIAVSSQDDLPVKSSQQRLPLTIQLANCFHDGLNWHAQSTKLRKL